MLVALLVGGAPLAEAARLEPVVACAADPDTTYALLLPDGWSPGGAWPVVLVLDPRGQAVDAAERFRPVVDTYGFAVASAYDSRSDELGPDPTLPAAGAILDDLVDRVGLAPGAVVLAGFSGTARSAWVLAQAVPDQVLGVVAVGGSTPRGEPVTTPIGVPWIGIAGDTDFNRAEVRDAARVLVALEQPARFVPTAGPHAWPAPDVLERAVGWVASVAVGQGRLAGRDVAQRYVDGVRARVVSLGSTWEAWLEAEGVPGLEVEADVLEELPAVRRRDRLEDSLAALEFAYQPRIDDVVAWLEDDKRPPPGVARLRTTLGLDTLRQQVERAPGTPRSDSAARRLVAAFAWLRFYVPRDLRVRGDHGRVVASLEGAAVIAPDDAGVRYDLACARTGAGDLDGALEDLADAIALGFADAAWARTDPDLGPLRADPRFEEVLARVGVGD